MSIGLDTGYMVNSSGEITFTTENFLSVHSVELSHVLGQQIEVILPYTQIHRVLQSGIPERHCFLQGIGGQTYIVSRIPVIDGGQIVGAWGFVEKILPLQGLQNPYFDALLSLSEPAKETKSRVLTVAQYDTPVLLLGETGCGKELFARAIHEMSPRMKGPFVSVNCAAISESLAESELFGYEAGAFTGASRAGYKGKFEQANGGTLFLDEIGDLPLLQQAKLLRVLQEHMVDPVGGSSPREVDVRIVAATHRDLGEMVANGTFRLDLFYRLNVVPIQIAPLRHQAQDIPNLARTILDDLCHKYKKPAFLTQEALALLAEHNWPGNIRELKNILERMLIFAKEREIDAKALGEIIVSTNSIPMQTSEIVSAPKKEDDKRALAALLEKCGGNCSQVARELGVSRALIYKKLHKYELF